MFLAKKSLGQNFIYDTNFLGALVGKLDLRPTDTIVEVGVGMGTLTECLASRVGQVIAYEIDDRLIPILHEKFSNTPSIQIIHADALKSKITIGKPYRLVANLPYYITTPLIMKFLSDKDCTEICVLVQREVADRIIAKPSTSDYGALSVSLQSVADCKIIKQVPRAMFKPTPNVDSAFVVIKKSGKVLPDGFDVFIKSVFSKRRKKISNSVSSEILVACRINPELRPENISPDQFDRIFQELTKTNRNF